MKTAFPITGIIYIAIMIGTASCSDSFFGGGNSVGGGDSGFRGGDTSGDPQGSDNLNGTGDGGINGQGGFDANGWPTDGSQGGRSDVIVDYGSDDPNLFVSANVYFNGDYSGKDALFTFYTQRKSPAPELSMREIIRARGQDQSDQRLVDKMCRCGKVNEFYFFWAHKNGRKGALHSQTYNKDPRLQGDWILAHSVSDDRWIDGNLEGVPTGNASIFLGADTENPTALLGMNPEGNGYLRTWYYHPNSLPVFATKEHRWDSRDDLRIAISCDLNMCPESLKAATEIRLIHHFSHEPAWKLP